MPGTLPHHLTTSTPSHVVLSVSFLNASLLNANEQPRATLHLRGAALPKGRRVQTEKKIKGPETKMLQKAYEKKFFNIFSKRRYCNNKTGPGYYFKNQEENVLFS